MTNATCSYKHPVSPTETLWIKTNATKVCRLQLLTMVINTALEYRKKFELWKHLSKRKCEPTHQVFSGWHKCNRLRNNKVLFSSFNKHPFSLVSIYSLEGTRESIQHAKQVHLLAREYLEYEIIHITLKVCICVVLDVIYMKPHIPCQLGIC